MMTNPRPERETRTTTTSTRRSSTSTSTTTTTVSPAPGRASVDDLKLIREAYVECIGQLTPPIARMIEQKIAAGMEVAVILHAIEETGWAPRPSAQYLRAILTRLHSMDVLTMDQLMVDQVRHEQRYVGMKQDREERWY